MRKDSKKKSCVFSICAWIVSTSLIYFLCSILAFLFDAIGWDQDIFFSVIQSFAPVPGSLISFYVYGELENKSKMPGLMKSALIALDFIYFMFLAQTGYNATSGLFLFILLAFATLSM